MYIHLRNIKLKDIKYTEVKTNKLIPMKHVKSIILNEEEKIMQLVIDGDDDVKLVSINGDFQRVKDSYNEIVNLVRKEHKIIEF